MQMKDISFAGAVPGKMGGIMVGKQGAIGVELISGFHPFEQGCRRSYLRSFVLTIEFTGSELQQPLLPILFYFCRRITSLQ